MAAAPKWAMLERFVSPRYDDESFPDESEALIRASGTTSWKATFSVSVKLAEPPGISRMYAHLPGFPGGPRRQTLSILANHQHLALLRVRKFIFRGELPVQDLFIHSACHSSLKLLPHCLLPELDFHTPCDGRPSGRPPPPRLSPPEQRVMRVDSMGLLCQDGGFVVAEANFLIRGRKSHKLFADIFWLSSSDWEWKSVRTRILSCGSTDNFRWGTNAVIPVRNQLCWTDYCNGILFIDNFHKPTPTVTLVRLPPEEFTPTDRCWMYRSVSAIDADNRLRFVKVDKHDVGFTITCHTVSLLANDDKVGEWEKDYTVTSKELWSANPPEHLPHSILMFPQVNVENPHIVHFLVIGESKYMKKNDMWVVSIDMKTKEVESYQYINAREVHGTQDNSLAEEKSACPLPFLAFDSSRFLHL